MFEDTIDNIQLIQLIEERPMLWDKTSDIYKDRIATKEAWRSICCTLKEDFDDLDENEKNFIGRAVQKRWSNLRDAFLKSNRKLQGFMVNGVKICKFKKYVYSDHMQFLNKLAEPYEAEGNTNDERHGEEQDPLDTERETTENEGNRRETRSQESQKVNRKRRQPDGVELKMIKALEPKTPNAHMCFFQGILPHLQNFDDSDVLEFQMGVLQVISKINDKKKLTQSPFCSQPFTVHPQSSFYPQQPYNTNQFNPNNSCQTFPNYSQFPNIKTKTSKGNNQNSQRNTPASQPKPSTTQHYQQFAQPPTATPHSSPSQTPSPALCGSEENFF